ncbi:hypothetical protein V1264_024964 [Littorina saxatilis]|uniref:Uncharacterized protein n=1 Tax=Littorina saxatilis TaxID=31220 RepID=A0AAN9AMB3_9CAEN
MILKLWLCTASFLGPILVVNSVCNNTPRPAGCQANNNQFAKDMDVYPPSAVNCSFAGNLCCYRQGCFDVGMGNWSPTNGSASVTQYNGGCGLESYSILESPWVIFSTPSCVQFAYSRRTPYQLQVFLAFSNGTLPSRMENSQQVNDNRNRTARFDIEHLTGKV